MSTAKKYKRRIIDRLGTLAIWIFPFLLIVPNLLLDLTEPMPYLLKAANIALPLGIYFLVISASRRTGLMILLCLPFMFYAAFQIVLIYLYGGSIISIDMLLNVVTTNASEASELLGNLLLAIGACMLLYLPPISFAVYALVRRHKARPRVVRRARSLGCIATVVGVLFLAVSWIAHPQASLLRGVFPANVAHNTVEAYQRYRLTEMHEKMSRDFSYEATSAHDDSLLEAYVLIVGETSRADNWQIFGYDRPTNPKLSGRSDIVAYPRTFSQSNTTHKSVPMIMSYLDANTYADGIYTAKSIISAFKDAGFYTAFLSTQKPNGSFIQFFGAEADTVEYIDGYDSQLIGKLDDLAKDKGIKKLFVVMHTYGSHFNYKDRYADGSGIFEPDDYIAADQASRPLLINAFDNTIVGVDHLLDSVATTLQDSNRASAYVYVSDHGEDIFDDSRGRFLHASPTPTYWQLHVPLIVWSSPQFSYLYPKKEMALRDNSDRLVASTLSAFQTMLDLGGIDTKYYNAAESLASTDYTEPKLLYINDYNEPVDVFDSGISKLDKGKIQSLATIGIFEN